MTTDDRSVPSSAGHQAEIKLAEKAFHLLMERLALGRMPVDALPTGAVYDLLDVVGELLHLETLREDGKKVPKKRTGKARDQLTGALERLSDWPVVSRIRVTAPLAEALEKVELQRVAVDLMAALPELDSLSSEEREASAVALDRIVPVRLRMMMASAEWTGEVGNLLSLLREMAADKPDDEELLDTLERGIVFNAISGRERLLVEKRRRLVEAEPLPGELADAVEQISGEVFDSELVRFSLHLVLADLVAAGLVPDDVPPTSTVAAAYLAILRRDQPDEEHDIRRLARWAKMKRRKYDVFADTLDAVFDWTPPGYEDSMEARHGERWRVESLMYPFLPVRWTPSERGRLPAYSASKASQRIEELREVAWLMIDPFEPVRFVSEAFRYGDGAPDEMDLEIVREIIDLWKDQSLVGAVEELDQAYLEDEWHDEDWDDDFPAASDALPALTTSDGEPLVFSTVVFEVSKNAQKDIVRHFDALDGFQREREDGSERWVWLESRPGDDVVIANLSLDSNLLTVQTHSVARSAKANALLVGEVGDWIVLKDIQTEQPTLEMLADGGIEPSAEEDAAQAPPDEQKRVVHEVLERHYRRWLGEPLQALGDVTPAEAVGDPERRSEVISLLVEFEERTRASTWPMCEFDFGFLWDELGLDR